jgi:hypothetical protein
MDQTLNCRGFATYAEQFSISSVTPRSAAWSGDYEAILCELAASLTSSNHALALERASLRDKIRGFGHIKQRNAETAKACEIELLGLLRSNDVSASAA